MRQAQLDEHHFTWYFSLPDVSNGIYFRELLFGAYFYTFGGLHGSSQYPSRYW